MSHRSLRAWYGVHKWTSLICTLFLFVTCLTALPLIFHEEIDDLLSRQPPYAALPASTPRASLEVLTESARRAFPGRMVRSLFFDDDEPAVVISLAKSLDADPREEHWIKFDSRTGAERERAPMVQSTDFLDVMFRLHTDLFAGLPGELFMGVMALLFVAAIVSGVVLYAPFMRKLAFGEVRMDRSPRLKWLDLHNLLSAATLIWLTVIGITGVVNELSTPLFGLWQITDVTQLLASYGRQPIPAQPTSVEAAFVTARAAAKDKTIASIVYPTRQLLGSPIHYVVWTKGNTPLTSQLFTPVLVDARNGALAGVLDLPWYLRALELSRPLHFGDYAGLPLKIIWAVLDGFALVVLGSGVYLWWVRRKQVAVRVEHLRRAGAEVGA